MPIYTQIRIKMARYAQIRTDMARYAQIHTICPDTHRYAQI